MTSLKAVTHKPVKLLFAQAREPTLETDAKERTGEGGELESLGQSRLSRHPAKRAEIDGVIRSRFEARHMSILAKLPISQDRHRRVAA